MTEFVVRKEQFLTVTPKFSAWCVCYGPYVVTSFHDESDQHVAQGLADKLNMILDRDRKKQKRAPD